MLFHSLGNLHCLKFGQVLIKIGVFMKLTLILASLFLSQLSFAQTLKEKKIKQEMIERTDVLISKISSAKEDIEREDAIGACEKIKEAFKIYPEHVKAIGTHMDISKNRSVEARNEALRHLMLIHRTTLICDSAANCENVDPKKLRRELKETLGSLEKNKKAIIKTSTGSQNYFRYEYTL